MITLDDATPDDVATIHDFICQLAAFEKEPDSVDMSLDQLRDALFAPKPRAEALVARVAGRPMGFAIWHENFNTWTGRPGLYLEDIFVLPQARGQRIGAKILSHLARLAVARGYLRLEWSVLDWNENAIGLYRKMGAEPLTQWTKYRRSGAALNAAAQMGA